MATIEEIQSRKLDLTEEPETEQNPHRANVRVWADDDEDMGAVVSVSIGSLWAQPIRFLDLTPDEARTLAVLLKQVADDIGAVER